MNSGILDEPTKTNSPQNRTFIRVTEIWIPSRNRSELVFYDGAYGDLEEFRTFSSRLRFAYGEGLPGTAWKERSPKILKDFEGSYFKRTQEAHQAGLTSAVAFPVFSGEFLRAVVVFLCGDTNELSGAIEIWKANAVDGLELADGYYGDLKRFEAMSRTIQFPRGHGLPGQTWKSGVPTLMGNLSGSSSFLRAKYAAEAGIGTGIGIPFFSSGDLDTVVTLLSSHSTPIADRFEVWLPNEDRSHLYLGSAIENDSETVTGADPQNKIDFEDGPIGVCWLRGIPEIVLQPEGTDFESMLLIPVIDQAKLNAVVVCYQ